MATPGEVRTESRRGSAFAPRKFSLTNPEKNSAEFVEEIKHLDTAEENELDAINSSFSEQEQKKLIRKIDLRLVPTLGFMYCVSLMDRTNLGIAVVAGMGVDMGFAGTNARYSIIVLVFFITYVLLQPPATVILRKLGPRAFLPAITILWGVVMLAFGFVRDWVQLIPLRLLLGIFEAGFFPGCAYLLSCWYPRYELQKRNAVFYLIGSMASAFAGIFAFGVSQMAGLGSGPSDWGQTVPKSATNPTAFRQSGIAGWRWIFIMEGLVTVVVGIGGYFLIVDFPEAATNVGFGLKFLNEREAAFVVARIEKDRHDAIPERFQLRAYLSNALDLKVWGFASLFMLTTTNTYAIAYFLPIILKDGMGFNTALSQCMVAPPYVMAAIVMFAMAYYGDKWHVRSPFILTNAALLLIGIPLLGFSTNTGVRYFGVFLATTSANANVPCILTWQANNIRGQWKRAFCSATLVGFGGIGGIIGSTVFRAEDNPKYLPGMYTCIICGVLMVIITLAMCFKFHKANKRAAAGGKPIEGLEGFRYTM